MLHVQLGDSTVNNDELAHLDKITSDVLLI